MILDRRFTGLPDGIHLNPMQELLVEHMEHRDNVLICAKTASGKSTAVPMLGTAELDEGKAILYVGSLKALVEEKVDDWAEEGHPWQNVPKTAISGDYTYDDDKIAEIRRAQIITITPESLISVIRNQKSDKAQFLGRVGIVFLDEGHLVGEEGRGTAMEVSMMELMTDYPDIRVVVMSATIPNHDHYIAWMNRLNNRPTRLVKSDYRPVQVERHFLEFRSGGTTKTEKERLDRTIDLVTREDKKDQQFLIGVHKKAFGRDIEDELKELGIPCAFYNADITDRKQRKEIVAAFKRKSIRVLITTSAFFTGVNSPARNVVNTHVEAGGNDIPAMTLHQLEGRAGRPQYDKEGDVYHFVPDRDFDRHVQRIIFGEPVESQLLIPQVTASHFLGAIYLGRIRKFEDFDRWYHKSLASVQDGHNEANIQNLLNGIVEDMKKRGMIRVEEDGAISLKHRGEICAQMLLDPYQFSDMIFNFNIYFNLRNPTDVDIARAIGKVGKFYSKWITAEEQSHIPEPIRKSRAIDKEWWKHCATVYLSLQGRRDMPYPLSRAWWDIKQDLDRWRVALIRACKESEFWKEKDIATGKETCASERIDVIFARVKYSCSWQEGRRRAEGITNSQSRRLKGAGLETMEDVRANPELAAKVLRPAYGRRTASTGRRLRL